MVFKSTDRRSILGDIKKVVEDPESRDANVSPDMEKLPTDVEVAVARIPDETKDAFGINLQAIVDNINATKPQEKKKKMEFLLAVFRNIQMALDTQLSLRGVGLEEKPLDTQDYKHAIKIKKQTDKFLRAVQNYFRTFSKKDEGDLKDELQDFLEWDLTDDSIQSFLEPDAPLRKNYRRKIITEAQAYLKNEIPRRRAVAEERSRMDAREQAQFTEERRRAGEAGARADEEARRATEAAAERRRLRQAAEERARREVGENARQEAERRRLAVEAAERQRLASLAEGRVAAPAEQFRWNEAEARRLGLERLDLAANAEADILIEQVIAGTIDITSPGGRKQFVESWEATCGSIPMPCVLWRDRAGNINWQQGDFWYLTKLKENRIVINLNGDAQEASTNFNFNEILLIDNWQETDFDAPEAANNHRSALLKELLGGGGNDGKLSTVNIRRKDIDRALWGEDPDQRIQTQRARDIIGKLGLNPDEFELRLIRQDEYARGSITKGWGQSNLSTNYENYFLGDDGFHYGLVGGNRANGGPSNVNCYWRVDAGGYLAVRLVLSRKQ